MCPLCLFSFFVFLIHSFAGRSVFFLVLCFLLFSVFFFFYSFFFIDFLDVSVIFLFVCFLCGVLCLCYFLVFRFRCVSLLFCLFRSCSGVFFLLLLRVFLLVLVFYFDDRFCIYCLSNSFSVFLICNCYFVFGPLILLSFLFFLFMSCFCRFICFWRFPFACFLFLVCRVLSLSFVCFICLSCSLCLCMLFFLFH